MIDLTNPIFRDAEMARQYLETQRWPDGPVCPHCGSKHEATKLQGKSTRPGVYKCKGCEKPYSVTVGTVFESSKIPLSKWLLATYLMSASKKGMSAKQIERMLGVTYKTAWFMMHRIREAMTTDSKTSGPIGGADKIVESDETFVGGKAKNVHRGKPVPKKIPVVALIERGGEARVRVVADVTAKTLRPVLFTQASRKSALMTDESPTYQWIGREFYNHSTVNHSKGEYTDHCGFAHVNTCESFFAIFKRGIMGSFHSVSEAHLQRYASEFEFRWNHRKVTDTERAEAILKASKGKRLTYRRTDQATNA